MVSRTHVSLSESAVAPLGDGERAELRHVCEIQMARGGDAAGIAAAILDISEGFAALSDKLDAFLKA